MDFNSLLLSNDGSLLPWEEVKSNLLTTMMDESAQHLHHYFPMVQQEKAGSDPSKLFTDFLNLFCLFGLVSTCIKDKESMVQYMVEWSHFFYKTLLTLTYSFLYFDMMFWNAFYLPPLNFLGFIQYDASILFGVALLYPIEAISYDSDPAAWLEKLKSSALMQDLLYWALISNLALNQILPSVFDL